MKPIWRCRRRRQAEGFVSCASDGRHLQLDLLADSVEGGFASQKEL